MQVVEASPINLKASSTRYTQRKTSSNVLKELVERPSKFQVSSTPIMNAFTVITKPIIKSKSREWMKIFTSDRAYAHMFFSPVEDAVVRTSIAMLPKCRAQASSSCASSRTMSSSIGCSAASRNVFAERLKTMTARSTPEKSDGVLEQSSEPIASATPELPPRRRSDVAESHCAQKPPPELPVVTSRTHDRLDSAVTAAKEPVPPDM
mmetsp:Transcript_98932/g.317223  ORF Transcript_98932/g.317223 Transcript_98932/m.317223 type:complete len:207 (+) Transcript_98932:1762-2382(+)